MRIPQRGVSKIPHLKKEHLALLVILLAAAGIKAALVVGERVPFNADEAVVALMARHILQGERPIFFYGQAYMGSLDAFLIAGAFKLLGEQVWVMRLVQGILYLGTLATTYWIGKEGFNSTRVGLIAAAILAAPVVNVSLYTTATLGGYGEALLIGNLLVFLGLRIANMIRGRKARGLSFWSLALGWGFLAGLGFWAFGFSLVYTIPVGMYLFLVTARRVRQLLPFTALKLAGLALIGFGLGALPAWAYALKNGFGQLLHELAGSAIALQGPPALQQIGGHLVNLLALGTTVMLGFRPPWEVRWLALPLIPVVLLFWGIVLVGSLREMWKPGPQRDALAILWGITGVVSLAFVLTPFGLDPSGRYFLPIEVALAFFAAAWISSVQFKRTIYALGLVGLVIVFNLTGTLQCALRFPPGMTTQFDAQTLIDHRYDQQLIDFLVENKETYGYTTYWVAYPLAFLSGEKLIFAPRLPYHANMGFTPRDDRYAPYDKQVANSSRVAYITARFPALDDLLRARFKAAGISWAEQQIGDYRVFYRLSAPLRPQEMGLGGAPS